MPALPPSAVRRSDGLTVPEPREEPPDLLLRRGEDRHLVLEIDGDQCIHVSQWEKTKTSFMNRSSMCDWISLAKST